MLFAVLSLFAVRICPFLIGVRRFDLAFDMGGGSAVRSAGLLQMEYGIAMWF